MPVINQFQKRDALQPVGTLQNYEVTWCPKQVSNQVGPDVGPPKFAVTTQKDGSVVAALQRQEAYAPSGAATTCADPATFTTAAYTDTYTLVPGTAAAQAPQQTLSGYACQGPLTWRMLPYSYDAQNGVAVDDGPGGGQAVAAALRLQVPYLPSGIAGGPGCSATVFTTHAVTSFAYLAPGTITALPPSATPTSRPSTTWQSASPAPTSGAPTASPSAAPSPSNAADIGGKVGAGVGGVLLGVLIIGGILLHGRFKKQRTRAALRDAVRAEADAAFGLQRDDATFGLQRPDAAQARTLRPQR